MSATTPSFEQAKSSDAVEELKRQGNDVLRQGNIQGAIDKYSEGVFAPPLRPPARGAG